MKKTISITLIFLCAIAIRGFAQVRQSAEIMPQFEGSTNGLKQWLAENMKYPEEAIQNKDSKWRFSFFGCGGIKVGCSYAKMDSCKPRWATLCC